MSSTPASQTVTVLDVVTPNGVLGASATDVIAFYGATPAAKPTITGSKGSNAALASLITALATLGLLVDSSS